MVVKLSNGWQAQLYTLLLVLMMVLLLNQRYRAQQVQSLRRGLVILLQECSGLTVLHQGTLMMMVRLLLELLLYGCGVGFGEECIV